MRSDQVNLLRQQLSELSRSDTGDHVVDISTGCEELDHLFPGNALRAGMLVEFLADSLGSGAATLAVQIASRAISVTRGCFVMADRWRRFYPPAAVARGIETKDLIVIRSNDARIMSAAEHLWVIDQALRSSAVCVVMAWIDQIDAVSFRRLQLAAESGRTIALLLRPIRVKPAPTWSDVQLLVQPSKSDTLASHHISAMDGANRFCRVTLLRQRGRIGNCALEGTSIELEIDEQNTAIKSTGNSHETRTMHMAPRLAHSTAHRRSARA